MSAETRQSQPVDYTRSAGSIWIDEHRTSLPDNEWVAADEAGLVAHDACFDKLMAKVRAKNIDQADVAVAFITSDPV
jgi:hypothetical protein